MKLVSFQVQTPVGRFVRVGAIHGHEIIDLNMAYARMLADQHEAQPYRLANALVPATMLELLEGETSSMKAARRAFDYMVSFDRAVHGPHGETIFYALGDVRILAPLPNPPSLRDFIAFEDHIAATSQKRGQPIPPEWYKMPVYYKGNHRTIIGPDDVLPWPLETTKLDYELELACIIGR
ncbi:MAG: 2-hydroxyhepta-2,4-diene-1,7-dioate isomerase, partial [Nitrospiraceae bacterium]